MKRIFLGIDLPAQIKSDISQQLPDLDARQVHPSDYHITLHFLGEKEETFIERVVNILQQVEFPQFEVQVGGVDSFGPKRDPRALLLNVVSPPLHDLHRLVMKQLEKIDIDLVSERDYHPHVTLYRRKKSPLLHSLHVDKTWTFLVTEFCLFSSNLQKKPHYEVMKRFALSENTP